MHIQDAFEFEQVGGGQIQRFVVDKKSDASGIGKIQHGLACFGESEGFFSVHYGPGFMKSVYEYAVFDARLSFVKISPHAEISVGNGKNRFHDAHQLGMKTFFHDAPWIVGINITGGNDTVAVNHGRS